MNNNLEKLLNGDRRALAKAITLVESDREQDRELAQKLLTDIQPHTGKSLRIGFTGVPGAGKSTLINHFGIKLIEKGHKVAVLAIDPSSLLSKGSILGDKTRMQDLAVENNAFIRPSPTKGNLGGVTRRTMESILLCEAAGYDHIIVETVGVGQSEVTVSGMVDLFITLQIPGAGDELQGIKKGIFEVSDLIVITKCDGQQKLAAKTARQQLVNAFHMQTDKNTKVLLVSSLENTGFEALSNEISSYLHPSKKAEILKKRALQNGQWLENELTFSLLERLKKHPYYCKLLESNQNEVQKGIKIPSLAAADILDELFL